MNRLRTSFAALLFVLAAGGMGAAMQWRVAGNSANRAISQALCQPFETALEARGIAWNALEIVPANPPPRPGHAEAELERLGGARFIVELDAKVLRKVMLEQGRDDVRRLVREFRLGSPAAAVIRGDIIEFAPRPGTDPAAVSNALAPLTAGPVPPLVSVAVDDERAGRGVVAFGVSDRAFEERRLNSQQFSMETMERRIREIGVEAGLVQAMDDGRILIVAPGLKEPERLFQLIVDYARLTFRIADRSADPCAVAGTPPEDFELFRHYNSKTPMLVRRRILASGEDVVAAAVVQQPGTGAPAVAFRLNINGANRLAQATREPGVQSIVIALDNDVIAAPAIRGPITGGSVLLSGGLTLPQARELALWLRVGIFGPPLAIAERQIVEPKPR